MVRPSVSLATSPVTHFDIGDVLRWSPSKTFLCKTSNVYCGSTASIWTSDATSGISGDSIAVDSETLRLAVAVDIKKLQGVDGRKGRDDMPCPGENQCPARRM